MADSIIVPGGNSSTSSQRVTSSRAGEEGDGGIIITPSPSSIVIKTRLVKGKFENDIDDVYVPPSISGICTGDSAVSNTTNDETKVFLNICSHQLIAKPCQRKALDEETGKEIDGWRLPMAMGELRPCYDKLNNAAIVADCILAPEVVEEMKSDSKYLHFVCDLVIQAASRKFGHTVFGGRELDKRYKLPRIKYVGYVDEVTGLPISSIHDECSPPPSQSLLLRHESDAGPTTIQKATVARQRVKGHGGKKAFIIEEIDSGPTKSHEVMEKCLTSPLKKVSSLLVNESAHSKEVSHFHIELLMAAGDGCQGCHIPLFDFLRLVTNQEHGVPPSQHQLKSALRELIRNPDLKQLCDDDDDEKDDHVHKSQRLKAPIPYDFMNNTTELLKSGGFDVVDDQRSWTLIAKVSSISSEIIKVPIISTTVVDLSTFLLHVVSTTGDSKTTDCVLPFPVDTRHSLITASYNSCQNNGDEVMEIRMPLLQSALCPSQGSDPGTPQFEILHALSSGVDKSIVHTEAVDGRQIIDSSTTVKAEGTKDEIQPDSYNIRNANAKTMVVGQVDKEDGRDDVDKTQQQHQQQLPEDAFHSQDILSRHYLQQQQDNIEMRRSMATNKDSTGRGADGADVEYINVDDFRLKPAAVPLMLSRGGSDSSSGGNSCVATVNNDLILELV